MNRTLLILLLFVTTLLDCGIQNDSSQASTTRPTEDVVMPAYSVVLPVGRIFLREVPGDFRVTGMSIGESMQHYHVTISDAKNSPIAHLLLNEQQDDSVDAFTTLRAFLEDNPTVNWQPLSPAQLPSPAVSGAFVADEYRQWLSQRLSLSPQDPDQKTYRLPQSRLPLAIPDQENTIGVFWRYDASQNPPQVVLECRNIDGGISRVTVDRKAGTFSLPQEQPEFLEDQRTLVCRLKEKDNSFLYSVRRDKYQLHIYKKHENSAADSARLLETFFLPLSPRVVLTTLEGP